MRPLPQSMWGIACGFCDKTRANWAMFPPKFNEAGEVDGTEDPAPVCSLCFLYESGWGKRRAEQIQKLIKEIEAKDGPFLLGKDGRIMSVRDTDKVLSGIALGTQVYKHMALKMMLAAEQEKEKDE